MCLDSFRFHAVGNRDGSSEDRNEHERHRYALGFFIFQRCIDPAIFLADLLHRRRGFQPPPEPIRFGALRAAPAPNSLLHAEKTQTKNTVYLDSRSVLRGNSRACIPTGR